MRRPIAHIIGAGFSGLSAALRLCQSGDFDVVLHEKLSRAGGRRHSFYDDALEREVDNGDYVLLTGWRESLDLISLIGARDQWVQQDKTELPFADMATGERWTLRPGAWPAPWWWISSPHSIPTRDVWMLSRLRNASAKAVVTEIFPRGASLDRLLRPLALAALNLDASRASARISGAALAQAFAEGAAGARLLFPAQDFARAFVDPAVRTLRKLGGVLRFERELIAMGYGPEDVATLEFADDRIELALGDVVILATPPEIASGLVPNMRAPIEFTATVTIHFDALPPRGAAPLTGVVNGPFHWLFARGERIGATALDAGSLLEVSREKLATEWWRAAAALLGLSDEEPAWRVIRRKRATFAATPAQNALRPPCATPWRNLFLAGGYVSADLPDTIETAVRSGHEAAKAAMAP